MLLSQHTSQAYGFLILQTGIALCIIGAAAWALRRFLGPKLQGKTAGQKIKILERLSLEPRKNLYLIEVSKKQLLVSSSENGINLVTQLPDTTPSNTQGISDD